LLVIGIKQQNGKLIFNPSSTHQISNGETLMVIGPCDKIKALKESAVV